MDDRVEIIILKYKSPDLESAAVKSIIEHTDHPYKLVLYDNRYEPCHFSKKWNELMRESTCKYVCIMDSDVEVSPHWLSKMLEGFKRPDVALVVPSATNIGCAQQMDTHNQGFVELHAATPVVGLYHKERFYKVGEFNESPEFAIFGQDSEWVDRCRKRGFRVMLQSDIHVKHVGNGSTRKAADAGEFDFEEQRLLASKKFKELCR